MRFLLAPLGQPLELLVNPDMVPACVSSQRVKVGAETMSKRHLRICLAQKYLVEDTILQGRPHAQEISG